MQVLWLPAIRAQLALREKNPTSALRTPQPASPVELGETPFGNNISCLYPVYTRGGAYLAAGQGAAAASEFQKILEHSGIVWNCWTGALAHLGVARANALQANTSQGADVDAARVRALAAYRHFLAIWKDADPDIPILKPQRRSMRSCSNFAPLRFENNVPLRRSDGRKPDRSLSLAFPWRRIFFISKPRSNPFRIRPLQGKSVKTLVSTPRAAAAVSACRDVISSCGTFCSGLSSSPRMATGRGRRDHSCGRCESRGKERFERVGPKMSQPQSPEVTAEQREDGTDRPLRKSLPGIAPFIFRPCKVQPRDSILTLPT
jgi:hypothetical protein